MTSVAETRPTASGSLELPASESAPSRNFNLRAYLAGAGATTALIAGAIVVFASLGAYVAFNGLPVGSGGENASQFTVGTGEVVTPAAGPLGRAAGAVAATAAAPSATAPAATRTSAGTAGSGPAGPADPGAPTDPATPGGPAVTPTTTSPTGISPVDASGTVSGGPVGGAVGGVSDATGLPLDSATGPLTKPLDDALGGAANAAGAPQLGQTATGLTGTLLP